MARRHHFQPAFERTSLPIRDVVQEVQARWFPQLVAPVPVFFAEHGPLACAMTFDRELAFPAVYYHQVLNHPQTPPEVLRFIAKHELLHFVVPPKQRGRYLDAHPPEFWDREDEIAPEARLAWAWIWANLHTCLKSRSRLRSPKVTRAWHALEFAPRLPWEATELQMYLQAAGDRSPRRGRHHREAPQRRGHAPPAPSQPRLFALGR
jgi:hypothetical protein